jgi:ABC-type long-subunit fatty acid transport system fused permease/ATPase subunit
MGYFIDRWTTIVDFLSVIRRLREFNKALDNAENVTFDDEGKQV